MSNIITLVLSLEKAPEGEAVEIAGVLVAGVVVSPVKRLVPVGSAAPLFYPPRAFQDLPEPSGTLLLGRAQRRSLTGPAGCQSGCEAPTPARALPEEAGLCAGWREERAGDDAGGRDEPCSLKIPEYRMNQR